MFFKFFSPHKWVFFHPKGWGFVQVCSLCGVFEASPASLSGLAALHVVSCYFEENDSLTCGSDGSYYLWSRSRRVASPPPASPLLPTPLLTSIYLYKGYPSVNNLQCFLALLGSFSVSSSSSVAFAGSMQDTNWLWLRLCVSFCLFIYLPQQPFVTTHRLTAGMHCNCPFKNL